MMRCIQLFSLALSLGVQPLGAQPPALVPKVEVGDRHLNVKTRVNFRFVGGTTVWGVVTKTGQNSVTLKYPDWKDKTKELTREVFVVDHLAKGNVVEGVSGCYAYCWPDVKEGDSVRLQTVFDNGDQRDYFFAVCIDRRPGARLPKSQKPKEDVRYALEALLNEIENGNDVSDADIALAYPPTKHPITKAVVHPGGLPAKYQDKLTAVREKLEAEKEKKDKDLKAAPPDKKK